MLAVTAAGLVFTPLFYVLLQRRAARPVAAAAQPAAPQEIHHA
jgi:hypothetical protein